MNNIISKTILRFLLLMLLQVAVFKQFTPEWEYGIYFHALIYPIFIIILPFRISKINVILLGFLFGIVLDLFYSSPGVHASACVFFTMVLFGLLPTVLSCCLHICFFTFQ